jgi:hypothetical protein
MSTENAGRARTTASASWMLLIGLALLFAFALAVRVPAFDRPPQLKFGTLYQDENKVYQNTLRVMSGVELLPHWPNGIYYILAPQFGVLWLAHTVEYKGRIWPPLKKSEFKASTYHKLEGTFALLRANALAFGLGVVALTFLLGRKIAGNTGGFSSALVVALAPVHVNYSRTMYYDMPMVFFFLLYLLLFVRAMERRSLPLAYAAVACSAAAFAMKQNAIVLFLFNVPLVLWVVGNFGLRDTLQSKHTYLILAVFLLVLVVGYPAMFSADGLKGFFAALSASHLPVGEGGGKPHLWEIWLTRFWPDQAPLIVLVFLLCGLVVGVLCSAKRHYAWTILLAGLAYYLVLGYSTHARDRMLMPLVPLLALGMAGWSAWFLTWRRQPLAYAALVGATIFVATPLFNNTLRYNLLLTLQDTRVQARDWLVAHAPHGAKIALESFAPHLPTPPPSGTHASHSSKTFNAHRHSTLIKKKPTDYVFENYDYLVEARWNYEKAKRRPAHWDPDAKRLAYVGKSPRWGSDRAEVLRRYEELSRFPIAARFEPRPVPADLMRSKRGSFLSLFFSNWWGPAPAKLWKRHDQYVLGSEIVIYQLTGEHNGIRKSLPKDLN